MNVLIVNTSERTGGAAVAANRLMEALKNNGVHPTMVVRRNKFAFYWERFCLFLHLRLKRKNLFTIDIANAGDDITHLKEFKEADVVHLHWINQGMLSLRNISSIIASKKPVVWTMHDFWSSTGICHYPGSCAHYKASCGNCQYLPGGGYKKDLSFRTWKRKRKLYERGNIIFVACSKWLQGKARESSLLKDLLVESIPNPIDTTVYCPADKKVARQHLGLPEDMSLILFVSQRITDERKGINYFIDAMNLLVERHPEMKQNTGVVILGGKSDEVADRLPVKTFSVGYVADEKKIIEIYNSVDLYVLPSLEDNLPNTIMESMACGVPCVGFKTGGIPEMIDHQKNGYVAEYKNTEDLARGIRWTLFDADAAQLSLSAVEKVKSHYSQNSIVLRYVEVYNQAIASSRIGI